MLLRVPAGHLVIATTDLGTGTATDATLTSHFSLTLSLLSLSGLLCLFAEQTPTLLLPSSPPLTFNQPWLFF